MKCNDCIYEKMCEARYEKEHCFSFKDKANFVEVVRCKDCTRWTPDGGYGLDLDGNKRFYGECSITNLSCREDHFCCFGHKNENPDLLEDRE